MFVVTIAGSKNQWRTGTKQTGRVALFWTDHVRAVHQVWREDAHDVGVADKDSLEIMDMGAAERALRVDGAEAVDNWIAIAAKSK